MTTRPRRPTDASECTTEPVLARGGAETLASACSAISPPVTAPSSRRSGLRSRWLRGQVEAPPRQVASRDSYSSGVLLPAMSSARDHFHTKGSQCCARS